MYFKKKFYLVFNFLRNVSLVMVLTFIGLAAYDVKLRDYNVFGKKQNHVPSKLKHAEMHVSPHDKILGFHKTGESVYIRIREVMASHSLKDGYSKIVLVDGSEWRVDYSLNSLWNDIENTEYHHNYVKSKSKIINYLYIDEISDCSGFFTTSEYCQEVIFDNRYSLSISPTEKKRIEKRIDDYTIN